METDGGRLRFSIGLDTRELAADAAEARRMLGTIGAAAEREGGAIDGIFKQVGGAIASVFTPQSAVAFAREVINVRKEIEGLEISFRTLLGSQEKADALFGSLRTFAAETPMDLKDLAQGAQTLLGFGAASEEVMPVLKAIGDISMGNSERFKALTLAFSQASSTGKLMGQDLMQMINAGFNPLAQMSETTGKSIGALKDEMAQGAISADMLKKAVLDAAGAGGRYHGMLAAQSQGLAGSLAQLRGAYADMLNDIGAQAQGAVSKAVQGAGELVRHYREVGEVLAAVAAGYGAYKAAMLGAEAMRQAGRAVQLREEAAELEALIGAQGRAKLAQAGLTRGSEEYAARVRQLAAGEARLAEVELARARAAVRASEEVTAARRKEYLTARGRETAARAELEEALRSGRASAVATAQRKVETAQMARQTAAQQWLTASRRKGAQAAAAQTAAQRSAAAAAALEAAATKGAAAAQSKMARMHELAANAVKKLRKALAVNPYVLAAAAAAALGYAIYKLVTYQTNAQRAQQRLNDAVRQGEAATAAEMAKVDALFGTLEGATKGTREYEDAKQAILSQYGEYLKGLGSEETALSNVAAAYEAVAAGVTKAARAKAKEAFLAKEAEEFQKRYEENAQTVQQKLLDKYGSREGSALLAQLREVMDGRRRYDELANDVRAKIEAFNKKNYLLSRDYGDGYKDVVTNSVKAAVQRVQEARAQLESATASAEALFGESAARRPTDLAGWQQRLAQLQQEVEAAQKVEGESAHVLALRRDIAEAQERIAALSKPPVKNKAYWEAQRKALQAERDALDAATDTKKIEELKARIAEINAILATYDEGSSGGSGGATERRSTLAQLDERDAEEARRAALAVARARVEGQREGFAREMAEAKFNYEQLRAENARRRDQMLRDEQERLRLQNRPAEAEALTAAGLPEEKRRQLQEYERIALEARTRAERAALAKVMEDVMTYQQRRLEVEEAFAEKRRALYEADGATLRAGVTEGNLEELARRQEAELGAVDAQFAEREEEYKAWLAAITKYTLEELTAALAEAESALANVERQGGGNALAVARAKVAQLRKEKARAEQAAEAQEDPGKVQATASAYQELSQALRTASGHFAALGQAIGGATGEMLSGVGEIMGMAGGAIDSVQQLVASSSDAMTGAAGVASKSLSALEKGSIILSIITTAVQLAMKIRALFDDSKRLDEEIAEQQAELNALQWSIDNRSAHQLWEQEKRAIEGMYAGLINAQVQLLSNAKLKTISAAKKQTQELERLYEATAKNIRDHFLNIGYVADGGVGLDSYKRGLEDIDAMARQMASRQRQIAAEGQKGKKQDKEKIAQWQREQQELAFRMARRLSEITEDIMGGSVADISGRLGDALVDSFKRGEDAAEAFKKKTNEIMADIIKRFLIKKILEPEVLKIFEFVQKEASVNGKLSEEKLEELMPVVDARLKGLEEYANTFSEALNKYSNFFGPVTQAFERSATARGIATASQDSVTELNGRMTAVQGHTYAIMQCNEALRASCAGILESVRGIELSAVKIEARLGHVESDVTRMRKQFEMLSHGGVKMR